MIEKIMKIPVVEMAIEHPLETGILLGLLIWFMIAIHLAYAYSKEGELDAISFTIFFIAIFFLFPLHFISDIIFGMNFSGVDEDV